MADIAPSLDAIEAIARAAPDGLPRKFCAPLGRNDGAMAASEAGEP